jgi:hypothetical protein
MATHQQAGSRSKNATNPGNVSGRHSNNSSKVINLPLGVYVTHTTPGTAASLALVDTKCIHCGLYCSFDQFVVLGADSPEPVHTAREWSTIHCARPSWERKRYDCTSRHQGTVGAAIHRTDLKDLLSLAWGALDTGKTPDIGGATK